MRKFIFFVVFFAASLHATTWYATSSSVNIDAANLWVPTSTGTCTGSGTALVWGAQANGDTFDLNGCTSITINVDPGSVSVQVLLTGSANVLNAHYFYDTSSNLTIHADCTTTTNQYCVEVTGSTGGLTWSGNSQGGVGGPGIYDIHTVVTTTYSNGTMSGGTGANSFGLEIDAAGPIVVNSDLKQGSNATAYGFVSTSSSTVTINGACWGGATTAGAGCYFEGSGTITLTGNIVNGKKSQGIVSDVNFTGNVYYVPASGSNYILWPKDSSYTLGVADSHATKFNAPGFSLGGNVQTTVQN